MIFRNVSRVRRFILCQNNMMFPWFCKPASFEEVYCFICGRRRVAVAIYRMFCLVRIRDANNFDKSQNSIYFSNIFLANLHILYLNKKERRGKRSDSVLWQTLQITER